MDNSSLGGPTNIAINFKQMAGGARDSAVHDLLHDQLEDVMCLVRLLGFSRLACGCIIGRYREVVTSREVAYVEEKGKTCGSHGHRRNHTIVTDRHAFSASVPLASKAS
jgi:hypothetical protein